MANKKIGITGHNGFLGNHIKNQIQYQFKDFELLDFKRSFFEIKNSCRFLLIAVTLLFTLQDLTDIIRSKRSQILILN